MAWRVRFVHVLAQAAFWTLCLALPCRTLVQRLVHGLFGLQAKFLRACAPLALPQSYPGMNISENRLPGLTPPIDMDRRIVFESEDDSDVAALHGSQSIRGADALDDMPLPCTPQSNSTAAQNKQEWGKVEGAVAGAGAGAEGAGAEGAGNDAIDSAGAGIGAAPGFCDRTSAGAEVGAAVDTDSEAGAGARAGTVTGKAAGAGMGATSEMESGLDAGTRAPDISPGSRTLLLVEPHGIFCAGFAVAMRWGVDVEVFRRMQACFCSPPPAAARVALCAPRALPGGLRTRGAPLSRDGAVHLCALSGQSRQRNAIAVANA